MRSQTGAAEAVYDWSGSRANRQAPKKLRLGGSGACPPLNFRRSDIDFGAFWDAFPAWQSTRINPVNHSANLLRYARCTNNQLNFAQISFSLPRQQCRTPNLRTYRRDRSRSLLMLRSGCLFRANYRPRFNL